MKCNLWRSAERFVGLFFLVLILSAPRAALAIGMDGSCDSGNISADCTINTSHELTEDLTVVGNLIIQTGGELRFGTATRTLTVGGNLLIDLGGGITAHGSQGTTGGSLTINVQGNATVDGYILANGGPSGAPGNAGGSGGALTANVVGDFTGSGTVGANGQQGSAGTNPSAASPNGGNGGAGGTGGTVMLVCGGNFNSSASFGASGGNGGNGRDGFDRSGGAGGSGGNGGHGANGGNGGQITIAACGDFFYDGVVSAIAGNGGNGGQGGDRTGTASGSAGNGGDNGSGGNGGSVVMSADGFVTVSGTIRALGGTEGNVGNAGACSGSCTTAGVSGSDLGINGAHGSNTLTTAQADINTTGSVIEPAANLAFDQPLMCDIGAGEGCGLGYWKTHLAAWEPTGYMPTQTVGEMFNDAPASLSSVTLLNALNFKGGSTLDAAKQILLRQAVAAVLNAAHPDVFYPRSEQSVKDAVNSQLAGSNRGTILGLSEELDLDNNLGCPLD